MHAQFNETIAKIADWAREDANIAGVVIIGSQARAFPPSDQWSDLDLMILAEDPGLLLAETDWIKRFGETACSFEEVVPLSAYDWAWRVKRVLYDDQRDIDFSILPYQRLDQVLAVNQEILCKGYQVLYDATAGTLDQRISALLETEAAEGHLPSEEEVRAITSDLLFHVIWAFKKIKRNELWVAVSCINCYMKGLLLRLIEAYNMSVTPGVDTLRYNGRFLEQRTAPEIIAGLPQCFTRYDAAGAVTALAHLFEMTRDLSKAICERNGYAFDAGPFDRIKKIYIEMKENEIYEHA